MQITLNLSDWNTATIVSILTAVTADIHEMEMDGTMSTEWHANRRNIRNALANELRQRKE